MKKALLLSATHLVVFGLGFALGVYLLPVLIAPEGPSAAAVQAAASEAQFTGTFRRDLRGSDLLHWGEGTVTVSRKAVVHAGRLSPGPDYKVYLSPEYVEDKAEFLRLKPKMRRIGDVKTFEGFIVPVPDGVDPEDFNTVVVWCETFSMFITAARYK